MGKAFRKRKKGEKRTPKAGEELLSLNPSDGCPSCKAKFIVRDDRVAFLTNIDDISHISMLIGCSCGARYQVKYSNAVIINAALPTGNDTGNMVKDFESLAKTILKGHPDHEDNQG